MDKERDVKNILKERLSGVCGSRVWTPYGLGMIVKYRATDDKLEVLLDWGAVCYLRRDAAVQLTLPSQTTSYVRIVTELVEDEEKQKEEKRLMQEALMNPPPFPPSVPSYSSPLPTFNPNPLSSLSATTTTTFAPAPPLSSPLSAFHKVEKGRTTAGQDKVENLTASTTPQNAETNGNEEDLGSTVALDSENAQSVPLPLPLQPMEPIPPISTTPPYTDILKTHLKGFRESVRARTDITTANFLSLFRRDVIPSLSTSPRTSDLTSPFQDMDEDNDGKNNQVDGVEGGGEKGSERGGERGGVGSEISDVDLDLKQNLLCSLSKSQSQEMASTTGISEAISDSSVENIKNVDFVIDTDGDIDDKKKKSDADWVDVSGEK